MRTKIIAALVLILPSWMMIPLENRIHSENVRLKYGTVHVTREMRDRIGQGMAIALLAGFRGVVADFMWIQSHGYWEKQEWVRQYSNMEVATLLEPLSAMFWDLGAWHMAWNIGYAVNVDPANRTHAEGIKRQREWWDKAREFLQRGIDNLPNRPDLYFSMGWLYWEKYKDPCKAAQYLHQAVTAKGAPVSMSITLKAIGRLDARAMEKCGDVTGAYQYWKRLWFEDHAKADEPWSVVEREIKRLEDLMNIPDNERVFPEHAIPTRRSFMKYAILSDIHSNLDALQVVLDHTRQQKCTHYVCLGDVVGYGPNPKECLQIIRELDCPVVMGNHDEYCAANHDLTGFNPMACDAIKWTREQLSEDEKHWLHDLKYVRNVESFTAVHATLDLPEKWAYVFDKLAAAASFNYQHTAVCFNGHTHVPIAFVRGPSGIQGGLYTKIKVEVGRKYFINVGSIGQPRDRNPKASYVIFDLLNNLIELHRLSYDIAATQKKIQHAGLPVSLADRLAQGR